MKLLIKRATDNDLALMQRLFYQTVTSFGSIVFTKEEMKIYSRLATNKIYWHKKFNRDYIYNAKLNGEIVASFSMDTEGNIEYFFVHMLYHGRGIAKKLYTALEKVAKENNIDTLTTRIQLTTRSFYEKYGYEIVENTAQVVGGEQVKSYIGVKKI